MLELVNISRLYKQKKGPTVKALDNVNITFNEKGMVFILGKSGSGKSTLLNVIGGLDKYTSGELFIKGKSTKAFKQNEFDSYRNTMIGFIFQEYNVLDEFNVGQNIGIALELQGKKATSEAINEILTTLDMQGYAHRKPNTLSGGQKQRVAIARALVKNPEIIMADEPTGALDSKTGIQLFEALKVLSKEKLVIVVTHDHEFAETYGDRIIEFSDGQVIRDVTKITKNETESAPTTFSEDGISIDAGYVLTEEDLRQINEYLRQKRTKVAIKIENLGAKFSETTQPEAAVHTEKVTLIRSRLPFKNALRMGASALKHKRFRLVLSILLASVAFTMFTLTDMMSHFNPQLITINQMTTLDITHSRVNQVNRIPYEDSDYYNETQINLLKSDMDALNAQDANTNYFPIIESYAFSYPLTQNVADIAGFSSKESIYSKTYITTQPTITTLKKQDLSSAGITMLAGELPVAYNEIAIPSFIYYIYETYGYAPTSGNLSVAITKPSDLINKKYDNFTITGIVDTGYSLETFTKYVNKSNEGLLAYLFGVSPDSYLKAGFNYTFFVSENYFVDHELPKTYSSLEFGPYSVLYMDPANSTKRGGSFSSAGAIESLNANNQIIYFDNTRTLASLTSKEIIVNFDYIIQWNFEIFEAKYSAEQQLVETLTNTNQNDQYIAQMLNDYYFVFGYEKADIKPYTAWDEDEQEMYRYNYYTALTYMLILYEENPYQPELVGKNLVTNAIQTEIDKLNLTDIAVNFGSVHMWEDQKSVYEGYTIVGFEHDYYAQGQTAYISNELITLMHLEENGPYSAAVAYHGSERASVNKFVNKMMPQKINMGKLFVGSNEVIDSLTNITIFMVALSQVFKVVGIIFAVFAALLLVNFITLSISFKKQEVGILRAIGARGIDVATIFMNEAGIIATINIILALIFTLSVSGYVNSYYMAATASRAALLAIGFRQIVLLFLISFGIALVSSFIPVFRLSLKKPIDAIKDR